MLLLFHKGMSSEGITGITNRFSVMDKSVYVTTIFEDDDDLAGIHTLELRAFSGTTAVCSHTWQLSAKENVYTMWFDLGRFTNIKAFQAVPLRAEAVLNGIPVLLQEASIRVSLSYNHLGQLGGRGSCV